MLNMLWCLQIVRFQPEFTVSHTAVRHESNNLERAVKSDVWRLHDELKATTQVESKQSSA